MLTCSKKYFRINDRKIDRIMDALQKILAEEREYSEEIIFLCRKP